MKIRFCPKKINILAPVKSLILRFILFFSFVSLLSATGAQAAPTLSINYEILTGSQPFDTDDTAGNDSSNSNNIIRTNDSVLINFQVGINSEDETNLVFTATTSPGIAFSLPPYCLTTGVNPLSQISGTPTSGQTITCNTGDHTSGTVASFSLPGRILPTLANGSVVEVISTSMNGDGSGSQNFPGQVLTVSAAPKFDIQKSRGARIYGSAPGPAGEPGLVQLYPILVTTTNSGFGAENATADIVLSDDLSGVSGNALLFQGWAGALNSACFANSAEPGYEINSAPYGYTQTTDGGPGGAGAGGAQQSVFNSGSFSCPSVSAGGTATITIAGADLSGINYPGSSFNGNTLPVNERYLVSGVLAVWFPVQDVVDNGGQLAISNTYIPQTFNSISGQVNLEPNISNNTKSYVFEEETPGAGRNFFLAKGNSWALLEGQTARRSGDGSLVAGQAINTLQRQSNGQAFTATDYNNLHLCTSFDNSKQIVRKRNGAYAQVKFNGVPRTTQPAFTLEYGTGSFGGSATCDNSDSPDGWVSDPTTLPGGIASVTKVRAVGDLIAPLDSNDPTRADLRVYYTALSNPVGTIVPQWGTYKSDNFNNGDWILSDYDAATALGYWGDRATMTAVVVRITKDTLPAGTASILAGSPLSFQLDWSATLEGTPPDPTAPVTITDTLPQEYAYTLGSASVTPTSVSNNPDGTTTLTWTFPAAVINTSQTPVSYDVLVKNTAANAATAVNTAIIASPQDPTPESARTAAYSVNILNSAILSVFKEAIPLLAERDTPINFKLSYANTGSAALNNLQMIDVLPDNSWTRNPATAFNGTLNFVSVTGSNAEVFEYTKTPLTGLHQDPAHASNQPGGSTIWCSGFSGGSCPATPAEVTAFRATLNNTLWPADGVQYITLALQPNGNLPNDVYSNNFSAKADELTISVTSITAKAQIKAKYQIAGTVFRDDDTSNLQNGAEPGIANITVSLFADNGTPGDISDDTLINSVTTTGDGSYLFNNTGPGTFRVNVDHEDPDLPTGAYPGTPNPVYQIDTNSGITQYADFGFDIFSCIPGGGINDPAVTPYISTEVKGSGISARNATDTLDDDWRLAAGLPLTGGVIPWFGYTAMGLSNNEPLLFNTRGVDVGVALVNIQPNAPCSGNVHTSGGPNLSTSTTMQQSAPRPASLYDGSAQPAFWNEASGHNSSPNAVRFTFASPVKAFGAWFGDLETRTDGFGTPAYLRLLDGSGNRIGADIAIEPQTISNGITTSAVDQNQCGSTASDAGCGNRSTRWIGFIDNVTTARIRQAVIIVGDDDFADLAGSESLSFIGMDINTGYTLSGRVYNDSNVNAADDGENGISSVTVVLHDTASNSCRSTQTNAAGYYAFNDVQIAGPDNYVVYSAAQAAYSSPASCPPIASDSAGFISSTPNTRTVTVSNTDISGINFGDVAEPYFEQDNQQTILPNSSVLHPHRFTANSSGSVSFSLAGSNDPANLYWGQVLYPDTDCDAQIDTNAAPLSGSLALNSGEQICLLVKVIAPANAGNGAVHTLQIQSNFSYGDGNSGLPAHQQTHSDITTVIAEVIADSAPNSGPPDGAGKLALSKSVWNISRNIEGAVALPGETLRYTIFYENIGNGPLNELIINDAVPAFTVLIPGSMSCADRPVGLAACVTSNDVNGAVSWRWTASDKLQPGEQGSVVFAVEVE